ncbi:hypothetical protein ACN091_03790 [Aliarcobacter butzleri]|uniref:hypothetical protein n=1 Tax=Aliarcobacter butzleri TaxID=28197 RepID=UPI003ADE225A
MKTQINILRLVSPPITNYDAERFKDDKSWKETLSSSNLYMIVQCYESFFIYNEDELFDSISKSFTLKLKIVVDNIESSFEINLHEFANLYGIDLEKSEISCGFNKSTIIFSELEIGTNTKIRTIETMTPKMVLALKSYGFDSLFVNFTNFIKLNKYYLHYIGISKSQDSFSRLVVKPHDKRLRILSNENTFDRNTRLTDEIMLLFFKIEPFRIQINETIDDSLNYTRLIADAEKAFISILNSDYNKIKYKDYPKTNDGLYNDNFTSYSYMLGNQLTLVTSDTTIKGDMFSEYNLMCDNADTIMIQGDSVELISKNSGEK